MPARLNGENYANFLRNELPQISFEAIENVPLAQRNSIWYMHDGAPAHYAVVAQNVLNERFPERWIGRAGPIRWPPRSPDLNPLDYFFWGHLKNVVHEQQINTLEELDARLNAAYQTVTPATIQRSIASIVRRAQLCIEQQGGYFEHLL